ncbi:MAG: hypothetical protein AB1782_15870 [Cyanobacteriota bacterium]
MVEPDFARRRDLLTQRLIEQIKTYNKKLFMQIFNYLFFIFIILPFILGAIFYLFGAVITSAVDHLNNPILNKFKEGGWELIVSNQYVHMILVAVAIVVFVLVILHYIYSKINFNNKEIQLAGFILAKVRKNQVITYQVLHKEIEFRSLSYKQFDNVSYGLQRLEHVRIEDRGEIENKLIIRDSSW